MIMKKYFIASAAIVAALMIPSCSKEQLGEPAVNEDASLVPMTFTAAVEGNGTKVALGVDGKTVSWEGTESIAVFDDVNTTIHKFDAESSGATTSFSGTVNSGATSFVAVYPYSDDIVYTPSDGNPLAIEFPSLQNAVLGGFDPKAAIYVATSTDLSSSFTFKPCFALIKVDVDIDDVEGIYVENSGKNMSGSVKVSTGGGIGDGTGTRVKNVALSNADGSVLAKGVYYIVVRHLGSSGSYTDFKVSYVKTGSKVLSRTASSDLTPAELGRKNILDIGKLSAFTGAPETNRLIAYQVGCNVNLAGKSYNIRNDSAPVVIASGTKITTDKLTAKLHFLTSDVNYDMSGMDIIKDVVIASTDPANPAVAKISSATKLHSGSLAIDGIEYDLSGKSSANMFNNGPGTGDEYDTVRDFDRLAFANCIFRDGQDAKNKYIYATSTSSSDPSKDRLQYAVNEVYFDHCVIEAKAYFTACVYPNNNHTAANNYKKFVFTNNTVYSTKASSNSTFQLVSYTGKTVKTGYVTDVNISNNIFYDVVTTAGYFRFFDMAKILATKNVIFGQYLSALDANPKIFNLTLNGGSTATYADNSSVTENIAYGNVPGDRAFTVCGDSQKVAGMDHPVTLDASPFASVDIYTGTFTLLPAYATYGPQE